MHILQSLDDSHDAHWEAGDLLRCFIIFCSLGLSADVSVRAELLPTPLSSSRKFCPVNRRAPSDWLRALSILLRLFWNTSRKQLLYSKHGSFWCRGRERHLGTYCVSRGHTFSVGGTGNYRNHAAHFSQCGCTEREKENYCSFK